MFCTDGGAFRHSEGSAGVYFDITSLNVVARRSCEVLRENGFLRAVRKAIAPSARGVLRDAVAGIGTLTSAIGEGPSKIVDYSSSCTFGSAIGAVARMEVYTVFKVLNAPALQHCIVVDGGKGN